MQSLCSRLCLLHCGKVILEHPQLCLCMSTSARSTHRPKRIEREEAATVLDPQEEKCNCVGPPDAHSNLRPMRFYIPPDETDLQRCYRETHTLTQEWNQEFWADHNTKFKKKKQEFIQARLKERYGDSKEKKMLSPEEMSEFYKSFLDDHRQIHSRYNREWYKKNLKNLLLSARVWLQQKTRK